MQTYPILKKSTLKEGSLSKSSSFLNKWINSITSIISMIHQKVAYMKNRITLIHHFLAFSLCAISGLTPKVYLILGNKNNKTAKIKPVIAYLSLTSFSSSVDSKSPLATCFTSSCTVLFYHLLQRLPQPQLYLPFSPQLHLYYYLALWWVQVCWKHILQDNFPQRNRLLK